MPATKQSTVLGASRHGAEGLNATVEETRKRDHQKRKGKKPKVEESSRQAPMIGKRSNSSIIVISLMRKTRQAEAVEAAAPSFLRLSS